MKKLKICFMLAVIFCLFSLQVSAITQQQVDEYNNFYSPQSIYNGGINLAPQSAETTSQGYVNIATGSSNLKVTDVSLAGVNGFNLDITRLYNSNNAALFEACIKETEVDYSQEYYMIVGKKSTYRFYVDSTDDNDVAENICLTPEFFTLCEQKSDEWMIRNFSEYEYSYTASPVKSKLFTSKNEALAKANQLNSNEYELEAKFPYDDTVKYNVNYYDFEVRTITKNSSFTDFSDGLIDDTATERYSLLGPGWEFDFPYIEIRYGQDENIEYLHFGEKGVWQIDFSEGGTNNLAGYSLNDIKLVLDNTVTHDGKTSKYRLDEKNGVKYYFAADGRLLFKEDRFGNQIKFFCDVERYTNIWGQRKAYPYVWKIIDTLGRTVEFSTETDSSENKFVYMTITEPEDESTRVYEYCLEKLATSQIGITGKPECDDLSCEEWVLVRVADPCNNTCEYTYNFSKVKLSFLERNSRFYFDYGEYADPTNGNSYIDDGNFDEFYGIHNTYALIQSATKDNNKSYNFYYAPFVKNCTPNGSMMFFKVIKSYEEKAGSYTEDSVNINEKKYYYDIYKVGEYDGYYGYKRDDRIGNDYNYAVKVTEMNLESSKEAYEIYKYTYIGENRDKTILLTQKNSVGTDHHILTDYIYNESTKLVTNVTNKNYSKTDASQYMETSVAYTYDAENYGDVLTETPNNAPDRAITYTYSSLYHFPLTKEYKKDSLTTIREVYNASTNGKSIESKNVYVNDVLKEKLEYTYDSYGNILTQKAYSTENDFVETQYTYKDGAYPLTETVKQVKNIDGIISDITVSSTYDGWGNQKTKTDANGNTTVYEYDEIGRPLIMEHPDGTYKEYEYSTNEIVEFDENGKYITYVYTNAGDIRYIRYNSLGVRHKYCYYTPTGQLETEVLYKQEKDPETEEHLEFSRAEYKYDTLRRPISKSVYDENNMLSYKELYSYDITSDYTKQTTTIVSSGDNPDIVISEYTDCFGNIIKKETGSDFETYTFDYMGNILSVKSAKASAESWSETKQIEYDHMGNVVKETNELGIFTRAEYDRLGRMIKAYDQNGNMSEFKYDKLGRVIEEKTPFEENNGVISYSVKKIWYDNNGNVIKESVRSNSTGEAEASNTVTYTYDNRNRLVMTESNDGMNSNYVQNYYDAKGNLLRVYTGLHSPLTINGLDDVETDEDNEYAVTKYSYDALGRLLTTTDALNRTESNVYDKASGMLRSSTDRNGNTFVYTYNGLGAVTGTSLSDSSNIETTAYTTAGQVLSKQNGVTTINYSYDNKGRLISESDSASGVVKEYTYDSNDNRLTFTLTRNGNVEISQSYVYDKLNRLISVSENGAVIVQYAYDNRNNRIQTTVSGGETTNYAYNIANMLISQTTGDKLTEAYTYYLNGNQKTKTSNGTTTAYEYDRMNRLVKENDTEYTFDDFGNRLTMSDGEVTTTYSYDLNNRLTESIEENDDIAKTTKLFYDYNGNQISKAVTTNQPYTEGMSGDYTISNISDNFVALYEYNCYNQLVGVNTNGVVSSYTYAPDGLRFSKTVGGNLTTFAYDNANVVEEITADGTNKYYRGIEVVKNDNGIYYLYNGQGDVSILADGNGATVADYVFDAYGNQSEENTVYNPFGYRGEYTDAESGLVYLRARMYDPQTGRFINEDPIRDGLNWYLYCSSNPINFIDPLGLFDYDDRLSPSTKYNIDVKVLQNELAWLGYYDGDIDGLFGQKTLNAVNAYKNAVGLGNTGADWGVVGAQTWSSLGLTYRTKADVDAGVKISTKGLKQYKDFTKPINEALDATAKVAEDKWRFNYKWFMSQVDHKKPWDIKREGPWNNTIAKDTYPGWGVTVVYEDYLMTPEELGNYTYGYIGAALGLTKAELYGGSWYAAGFPTGGADWDNEYNDWSSIKKGADDYK